MTPQLRQLGPHLYGLRIPEGPAHLLNCYLYVDDDVTLIDTGWPGSSALIAEALRALGRKPRHLARVVLTHFHDDHAGAAAEVAAWRDNSNDIEIVAGRHDADYVRGAATGPLPILTAAERQLRPDNTTPPQGPPCRVDRVVTDGDVLDFAGGTRVIDVPGHTPGSIALYLPAAHAVLTGDAVAEFNGEVILGVFNTDRSAAAAALSKLADTGAQAAGFGHGEPVLQDAASRIANAADPFA